MIKISYKNNVITKVPLGFESGGYCLIPMREMSYFNVDNDTKSIKVEKCRDIDNIPKTMKFRVWENSYNDLVLPGKTEYIHMDTLVRSFSYDTPQECKTTVDEYLTNVLSNICDMFCVVKHCHETDYKYVRYQPTVSSAYILPIFESIMRNKRITCRYIPVITRVQTDSIKSTPFMLYGDRTFDVSKMECKDVWMVFSKLEPTSVYFVKSFSDASRLLGNIKFGPMSPFFHCGVSVFEDYYIMPIIHNKVKFDHDNFMITLSDVNKDHLKAVKDLKAELK